MSEEWVHLEGMNFEVSSFGRMRNLDGSFRSGYSNGRYVFTTSGGKKLLRVHRLIALAFIGPAPFEGAVVRHLNDIGTDNRVQNLAWGTATENMLDRVRNGIHPMAKRTHCVRGHQFTAENTRVTPKSRVCRTCERAAGRAYRRRSGITTGVGRGGKVKNPDFINDPGDERHGTLNGYANLKCRCDRCRAAAMQHQRATRKRRREVMT